MKNVKKVLSVLLAALMLYAIGVPFASATEDDDVEWKEVRLFYEDITALGELYVDWYSFNEWYKTTEGHSDSTPEEMQHEYTSQWWDKLYYCSYTDPVHGGGPHYKLESSSTGQSAIIGPNEYTQEDEDLGWNWFRNLFYNIKPYMVPRNWVKWNYDSEVELSEGDYYIDKEAFADWLVSSGKCNNMEEAKIYVQDSFNIFYHYQDADGNWVDDFHYTYQELYFDPQTRAVLIVWSIHTLPDGRNISDYCVFPFNPDYQYHGFQFIRQYHASAQPDQPAAEICHWCGQPHGDGFFQKIIAFFHRIFAAIFGNKY